MEIGATASNILGLACGREYTVNEAVRRKRQRASRPTGLDIEESNVETVGEHGLLTACQVAGINNVQILTTMPHSSLRKAASVVGLGRSCVREVSLSSQSIAFDLDRLEEELKNPASASIVVISCAEVNTGLFATGSYDDVRKLRSLCDQYGAWLHVDAGMVYVIAQTFSTKAHEL